MGSVSTDHDDRQAAVGTNVVYGPIHQFGGKTGRNESVELPARPFLPLTGAVNCSLKWLSPSSIRLSAILKQRPVAEFCLYRRVIYHCQPLRGCITFIKALQPRFAPLFARSVTFPVLIPPIFLKQIKSAADAFSTDCPRQRNAGQQNASHSHFKAGTHTDMHGTKLPFTQSDLAACVKAYDPSVHEAPLVIGHPKTEDPAWGWVKSLSLNGGDLLAEPDQLDPQFAELVGNGRFKKVSASFYLPDSPNNPKPGTLYLRHVGFRGAATFH